MYSKSNHSLNKIAILLKQERKLFHTNDLAILWQISNKNTLYTTIKRYVKRGVLIPIHKGFYSVLPLNKINPVLLIMGYLHKFCYLSLESVLSQQGIISQHIPHLTLASSTSKKIILAGQSYLVRKMKNEFLFNDLGIISHHGYKEATIERAVADLLYFNPYYHFDANALIDWDRVKYIQREVFKK